MTTQTILHGIRTIWDKTIHSVPGFYTVASVSGVTIAAVYGAKDHPEEPLKYAARQACSAYAAPVLMMFDLFVLLKRVYIDNE